MEGVEVRLTAVLVDRPGRAPLALCEMGNPQRPELFTVDPELEPEDDE